MLSDRLRPEFEHSVAPCLSCHSKVRLGCFALDGREGRPTIIPKFFLCFRASSLIETLYCSQIHLTCHRFQKMLFFKVHFNSFFVYYYLISCAHITVLLKCQQCECESLDWSVTHTNPLCNDAGLAGGTWFLFFRLVF